MSKKLQNWMKQKMTIFEHADIKARQSARFLWKLFPTKAVMDFKNFQGHNPLLQNSDKKVSYSLV